jgi:Ca2+-binding EF-hand superfamily protein
MATRQLTSLAGKEEIMRGNRSLVIGTTAVCVLLGAAASQGVRAQSEGEPFSLTDIDKNGSIDRQEYQRRMVEVFYFADNNKDGVVTVEELAVIETVDPKAFRTADKNGDDKLTVDEFVAYRMVDFTAADANKDGVLTYEEVQVWRAAGR